MLVLKMMGGQPVADNAQCPSPFYCMIRLIKIISILRSIYILQYIMSLCCTEKHKLRVARHQVDILISPHTSIFDYRYFNDNNEDDNIPLADFDAPKDKYNPRDSSSTAIVCSALLDLFQLTGKTKAGTFEPHASGEYGPCVRRPCFVTVQTHSLV